MKIQKLTKEGTAMIDPVEEQAKLDRPYLARILLKEEPRDLAEFIYRLVVKPEQTFFGNGGVQCDAGRRRSTDDIYRASRNYFSLTYEQINAALIVCVEHGYLERNFCSTILHEVHVCRTIKTTERQVRDSLGNLNVNSGKSELKRSSDVQPHRRGSGLKTATVRFLQKASNIQQ